MCCGALCCEVLCCSCLCKKVGKIQCVIVTHRLTVYLTYIYVCVVSPLHRIVIKGMSGVDDDLGACVGRK
jgi:hypothetical protein